MLSNVCESLLRLNPDFSLSPGLAESFAHPTPTTWVYKIRDGVTFHDGTPLTADDVVASMNRHLDPAVGSSWFSVYQNVKSIEKTGDHGGHRHDDQARLAVQPAHGRRRRASSSRPRPSQAKGADYGNSTGGVNCTGPFELRRSGSRARASPSSGTTTTGTPT